MKKTLIIYEIAINIKHNLNPFILCKFFYFESKKKIYKKDPLLYLISFDLLMNFKTHLIKFVLIDLCITG